MKKTLLLLVIIITLFFPGCSQTDTRAVESTAADAAAAMTESPEVHFLDAAERERTIKAAGDSGDLNIAYSKEIVYSYIDSNEIFEIVQYDFNDQDLAVRRIGWREDSTIVHLYTYDDNNHMIESITLDGEYQPTGSKVEYLFSEDGKEVLRQYYREGGYLGFTIAYVYDEKDLLTKEIYIFAGREPFDRCYYIYDENDLLIRTEVYSTATVTDPDIREYVCDEEGRPLIISSTYGDSPVRQEFTYYEDGSYKTERIYESNGEIWGTTLHTAQGVVLMEVDDIVATTIRDIRME